jgi:hypothetical protein
MHEDGATGHRLTIIHPEVVTQSADAEDNELRPVRHAGKDGSVDQRIGRAFSADRQVSSATSDWVNLIELRYPGRNDPRLLRPVVGDSTEPKMPNTTSTTAPRGTISVCSDPGAKYAATLVPVSTETTTATSAMGRSLVPGCGRSGIDRP